jgi:D-inositol-3-phosphate glycosyltransferase
VDIFTRIQSPEIRGIKNVLPNVRVIHLKGGPEHPVDRRHLYNYVPEFSENMIDFINQERKKYNIVYSHYWLSGLAGKLISQKFNLPLVHMYHTLAFLKKRMMGNESEHEKRLEAEEHLAYFSEAIISSSRQERKNLVEFYGISPFKIKIIYPGVNNSLFYPSQSREVFKEIKVRKGGRILLYVGRIEPVKGLITIIETLALLREKNPALYEQLKLVVIGGGKRKLDLPRNREFNRIREYLKKEKLMNKVLFLGSKKQPELRKYYSAADVLIVPSLYESFGLVVIEALACGTPVLVSQIGEMRTIVREGKNGFSFYPNNPLSLSRTLEHFFSREKRLWPRKKISENVVRKFSWERTAEETYRFLAKISKKDIFSTTIFPPDESLQLT